MKREGNKFVLAYQTLGMVYGGLCITPLYLYSSLPFQALTQDDYLGLLSIIFWTLTLIGGVKYVLIVLHADDHGEGGTFALYSLLCRHINITLSEKKQVDGVCSKGSLISWISQSKAMRKSLFYITMLATCMVMGDGILTPPISVLSAVEGLKVAAPFITQDAIVMISSILLIGLFLLQRVGTQQISFIFSPVIVAWLTTTPLIGLYNIFMHFPNVYQAISPYYALKFFFIHGKQGWLALGGTTLCITGVEAMFADLGHFNKPSMQLGFLVGVYPSNIITYAGLTAYLIKHPEHQGQAFYKFTPKPIFWPMFILSTFAAIVASQGLISACFSLIKQCVAMDCFPSVQIMHTSNKHEGQVYSPQVNFSLMVLCTVILIGFHNGNSLGNAYGVAVIFVMLITTFLVTLVMVGVWGVSAPIALSFFSFFTLVEICNLSAVLTKVPAGGWLPFLLAFLLAILVLTWVEAHAKLTHYELYHSIPFPSFTHMLQKAIISRVPGVCFIHMLPQNPMQNPLHHPSPNTTSQHAYITSNHLKCHLNHGYTDHNTHDIIHELYNLDSHLNQYLSKNIKHTNSFSNHKAQLKQHQDCNHDHFEQHLDTSIDHISHSPHHHIRIQHNEINNQIHENNICMNHIVEVDYHEFVDGNTTITSLSTSMIEPSYPSQIPIACKLNIGHNFPENTQPQNGEHNEAIPSQKSLTNLNNPLHQPKEFFGTQKNDDSTNYDHIENHVNHFDNLKECSKDPSHHINHANCANCLKHLENGLLTKCNISMTHQHKDGLGTLVPPPLQHYVQNTRSLHRLVVLTRLCIDKVPEVTKANQFEFEPLHGRLPNGSSSQEVLDILHCGLYLCTIHVGYAQQVNEQCKALTWQLLEHLEDFIQTKLILASSKNLVESRKREGQLVAIQNSLQEWQGQVEEVERAKLDMEALTVHMVSVPRLKLPPESNFLAKLALHKLYPLLQFYNPLSPILSQVPIENVLEFSMTYKL